MTAIPARRVLTAAALVLLGAVATCRDASSGPAAGLAFHPRDARVWDAGNRRFVWRDACGNDRPDHRLGGGFAWEGDARDYIALGEASVRGQRRDGLVMLAFPDGNVLHAAWTVAFPKGHAFRVRYALTDGLRFTVTATDAAGQAMLEQRPRADMPGFRPCEPDRQRERKYVARRAVEARNREAIREGGKAYDGDPPRERRSETINGSAP